VGHEDDYIGFIGFFLDNGVRGDGLNPELRARFVDSYRGTESLRCGFEHYRSLGTNARLIDEALARRALTLPTMAIGSHPISAGLYAQLQPAADDLVGELIGDCGHAIPLARPDALLDLIGPFPA
jgi:hypothetical protein